MGVVEQAIENTLGYTICELRSRKRNRYISEARFIWANELFILYGKHDLIQIAEAMERCHSNVIYCLRRYSDLFEIDSSFRNRAELARKEIDRLNLLPLEYHLDMWICIDSSGKPILDSLSTRKHISESWIFESFDRTVRPASVKITLCGI